jgi:Mn-dependent DtxR family transcriptional regulator
MLGVESITLTLSDYEMVQVKALAEKMRVTPEEVVKMILEQRLRYEDAVDHVLEKNAELYRRLA